jgi:hypothetical protein
MLSDLFFCRTIENVHLFERDEVSETIIYEDGIMIIPQVESSYEEDCNGGVASWIVNYNNF